MGLQIKSPPAVEPVSLEELKEFLRLDSDDISQDGTILDLATAARYHCENFTKKRFIKQSWSILMDSFPGYIDMKLAGTKVSSPFVSGSNAILVGIRYAIVLPFPPVRSIDLFQYLNANGTTTPLTPISGSPPAGGYVADIISNPARLMPPFGSVWPVARVVANAVEVDFTTGYAEPITVTTTVNSNVIGTGSPPGYAFLSSDVGRPIYIPWANPNGATLATIISTVSGGTATIRDQAGAAVTAQAILVNCPSGIPGHWSLIRNAIKFWVTGKYYQRLPDKEIQDNVKAMLWPVRDLRN